MYMCGDAIVLDMNAVRMRKIGLYLANKNESGLYTDIITEENKREIRIQASNRDDGGCSPSGIAFLIHSLRSSRSF